jgi:hypothetical protein
MIRINLLPVKELEAESVRRRETDHWRGGIGSSVVGDGRYLLFAMA